MSLLELLKVYKELGFVAVILIVLVLVVRYQARINKQCHEEQKQALVEHKNEIKGIAREMFEVINRNTEAKTQLTEAVKDISRRVT